MSIFLAGNFYYDGTVVENCVCVIDSITPVEESLTSFLATVRKGSYDGEVLVTYDYFRIVTIDGEDADITIRRAMECFVNSLAPEMILVNEA